MVGASPAPPAQARLLGVSPSVAAVWALRSSTSTVNRGLERGDLGIAWVCGHSGRGLRARRCRAPFSSGSHVCHQFVEEILLLWHKVHQYY